MQSLKFNRRSQLFNQTIQKENINQITIEVGV